MLVYEGLRSPATSSRLRGLWRDPRAALRQWLSSTAVLKVLDADLDRAVAQLHHKAAAFEVQLADSVRPTRLGKAEAFRFFRRLLNYTPAKVAGAALQYDTHLDYFVADCAVECQRTHLEVDAARVKILTMKEPPSATFPRPRRPLHHAGRVHRPPEMAAESPRSDAPTCRPGPHFFQQCIVNYVSETPRNAGRRGAGAGRSLATP